MQKGKFDGHSDGTCGIITSFYFNERYAVGNNYPVINKLYCPIDGTPMINVMERDFSHYECNGCGLISHYKNEEKLKESAIRYAKEKNEELNKKKGEIAKLEKIISVAITEGILKI